jgi:hypothetical protein
MFIKGGLGGAGFESGLVEGAGGAYGSSSYESSSYSSGGAGGAGGFGVEGGFAGGAGGGYGSSSYETSGYGSGGAGGAAGFDVAAAAFSSADKNKDGTVDVNEFKQFYQGGL